MKKSNLRHYLHVHYASLDVDRISVQFNKISYLNTVVASCYSAILNFHIWRWMRKLALAIGPSTLLSLILSTNFQLKPARIFLIEEGAHVEHGDGLRVDVGGVGHDGSSGHAGVQLGN